MASTTVTEIVCAHSPDSDDAYMFYGLATKKVRSRLLSFRHVLEDIETLNRKALEGAYELTAISYHAYPYIADKYVLMASGSSIGDGYGPILASIKPMAPDEIKGKKIAIPGKMTTAYLTLKLFEPDFEEVVVPFDKILDAVAEQTVDAGLIIHEGQLTYGTSGLYKVIDLGVWWRETTGLVLPLGGNAIRRSLGPEKHTIISKALRDSIRHALDHREQALEYAMQFARDLDTSLASRFVSMYVNERTLDYGPDGREAIRKLLDLGHERGVIPIAPQVDFVD